MPNSVALAAGSTDAAKAHGCMEAKRLVESHENRTNPSRCAGVDFVIFHSKK
jgi:hypothetical protein